MNQPWALLVLMGLFLGAGIVLARSGMPHRQRLSFAERVAPQLRRHSIRSGLLSESPESSEIGNAFIRVFRPFAHSAAQKVFTHHALGDTEPLDKRLKKSGSRKTALEFRAEQLMVAAVCAGIGVLLFALGWAQGTIALLPGVIFVVMFGIFGFMLRNYALTRAITAREKIMLAEFPAIAELMALSVTAGESALASLERVCRSSRGELSSEFAEVLSRARSGVSVVDALQTFAKRIDLPSLSRFVDGITVAIERGTPLADVLRSQAQDVRDHAKRDLMEVAGKKEIAMMAPVVFLILPLTVIFAVFPGLAAINIGV